MTANETLQLQPLGLGALLDRAIRLYRQNFVKFVGIIAIMQIPVTILQLISSLISVQGLDSALQASAPLSGNPLDAFGPGYFIGLGLTLVVALLSFFLIQGVATACLARAVTDSYVGNPAGILESYQRLGRSWISLVAALLLASLLSLVLIVYMLIPCLGWLTGPGLLTFLWAVLIPVIAPIIVIEKKGARDAILRAWNLTRRRFWWMIGFILILYLFAQIVIGGPSFLVSFISQSLLPEAANAGNAGLLLSIQALVQALITMFFSLLYLPLQQACITLVYFDLRVRFEGLDLVLLAHEAAGSQELAEEIASSAPDGSSQDILTWNEAGYFVLLSAGLLVIYFLLLGAVLGLALMIPLLGTGLGNGF